MPEELFVSYIVFSDRCELMSVPRRGEGYRVCQGGEMLWLMRSGLDG